MQRWRALDSPQISSYCPLRSTNLSFTRIAAHAQSLSGLLSDGKATLVSLEIFEDVASLAVWCRALHDAGVSIRWDETTFLSFSAWEDAITLSEPLVVGAKGTNELVKADELRQWWARLHDTTQQFQAVRGATAEAVFRSLDSPQFVRGFRCKVDGDVQHVEIWRQGPLALQYWYTANAVGGITRQLAFAGSHMIREMARMAMQRHAGADAREVVEYDAPEDAHGGCPCPKTQTRSQTDAKHTPPDLTAEAGCAGPSEA